MFRVLGFSFNHYGVITYANQRKKYTSLFQLKSRICCALPTLEGEFHLENMVADNSGLIN